MSTKFSKTKIFSLIFGPILFVFDQLVKWYVISFFSKGGFFIINDFFVVKLYKNKGFAFGFLMPRIMIIAVICFILVVLFFQLRYWLRKNNFFMIISLELIIFGALSNLADRIFRGYVVDFLNFFHWSAFNLADIAIVIGVGLLIFKELKFKDR